jgi:hypothetical protein
VGQRPTYETASSSLRPEGAIAKGCDTSDALSELRLSQIASFRRAMPYANATRALPLILTVFLSFLYATTIYAQTEYSTESETDIYWQPNAQIDFSDYQSQSDTSCVKYNEKYGFQMSSSIGFRGVVDIPKKSRKFDKFYLAPTFCKNCSCILSEDSLGLKVDRLLFDVAETFVRGARRELLELQEQMKVDNTYTMMFTTVKNKWDEQMRDYFGTILREVLIEKKDSAYIEWRKTVDDLLQQTEKYATRPEDCYRFISRKPIEKNYKMAENIMGDMRNKEK